MASPSLYIPHKPTLILSSLPKAQIMIPQSTNVASAEKNGGVAAHVHNKKA